MIWNLSIIRVSRRVRVIQNALAPFGEHVQLLWTGTQPTWIDTTEVETFHTGRIHLLKLQPHTSDFHLASWRHWGLLLPAAPKFLFQYNSHNLQTEHLSGLSRLDLFKLRFYKSKAQVKPDLCLPSLVSREATAWTFIWWHRSLALMLPWLSGRKLASVVWTSTHQKLDAYKWYGICRE